MRVVERPFSEFLRHPNDVVAELAEHDVMLRRRNAPALWLTRADHHTDRREAFEATARLLRNLAAHSPGALVAALEEAYAWVEFLPSGARNRFAEELTRTLLAAASVDLYTSIRATSARMEGHSRDLRRSRTRSTAHRAPGGCRRHRRCTSRLRTMAKRRERVAPPPVPGGWDFRYATSDAVKGWAQISAAAPGNARVAWESITADPPNRGKRQHPLKDDLARRVVNGTEMEQ